MLLLILSQVTGYTNTVLKTENVTFQLEVSKAPQIGKRCHSFPMNK